MTTVQRESLILTPAEFGGKIFETTPASYVMNGDDQQVSTVTAGGTGQMRVFGFYLTLGNVAAAVDANITLEVGLTPNIITLSETLTLNTDRNNFFAYTPPAGTYWETAETSGGGAARITIALLGATPTNDIENFYSLICYQEIHGVS